MGCWGKGCGSVTVYRMVPQWQLARWVVGLGGGEVIVGGGREDGN